VCVRVLCAQGRISPGGAQRRLMLSVEQRIISLLAFPFIDFPLKNVPVTDEKLEKYGGDAAAFIQFRPFLPRSQCIKRWEMRGGGPLKLLYFRKCRNKDALKIDRQRLK
jgi:hypothetical protein